MVQFETFVEEREQTVCGEIKGKFGEELDELFLETYDSGKEHCIYLYRDGMGIGATSFGVGMRGGIPRDTKYKTRMQAPADSDWAVYIHTHPPGDLRASVSDMYSFANEVHDTIFDDSDVDVIAHFILTNIDMQEEKELVLFGFERKPGIMQSEVRSVMLTLDDAVDRQDEILRTGDIEAMNTLITDSVNDLKEIANLCFEHIGSGR